MDSIDRQQRLTPELIRQLLDNHAQADSSAEYVRLMEIYCVVKTGGTSAQIDVARRLEQQERAALTDEIEELSGQADMTGRVAALKHEIQEVKKTMANRLAYLQGIDAQEETQVRNCMPLIEAHFAHLGHQHRG